MKNCREPKIVLYLQPTKLACYCFKLAEDMRLLDERWKALLQLKQSPHCQHICVGFLSPVSHKVGIKVARWHLYTQQVPWQMKNLELREPKSFITDSKYACPLLWSETPISVFQGCWLYKHFWKGSLEQRIVCTLLIRHEKCENPMENCLQNFISFIMFRWANSSFFNLWLEFCLPYSFIC